MRLAKDVCSPTGDPLADLYAYESTTVAALLTARGGSSWPHKNLRLVLGKPAMTYPLMAAKGVEVISQFFASSDDELILDEAEKFGYLPIERPGRISGTEAQHIDAVKHAIEAMRLAHVEPDILVVLMGNSVCTKSRWIKECVELLCLNAEIDSVIPVVQDNDHHPWRAKTVERGRLVSFVNFQGLHVSTNRGDLSPCYFIAQNFWVIRLPLSEHGESPWTFLGETVYPYIVPPCPDIHTEIDILLSEKWLEEHQ